MKMNYNSRALWSRYRHVSDYISCSKSPKTIQWRRMTNHTSKYTRSCQPPQRALQANTYLPASARYLATSSTATATLTSTQSQQDLPAVYKPPTTGIISRLPSSWIPYAELIRLDKPAGTYYLFFPCMFSTLLAAPMAVPMATPLEVVSTTTLFFAGALIMRGAGCTINDLWDRNLDPFVERTRLRPIARKAVSVQNAVIYLGAQLVAGLAILLQFPLPCLYYGVPSLLLVTTYPLAKRVTHYPQFVLGLTFSWGAIMGFPALGIDLLSDPSALAAATALYSSCVAWTLVYDMIYAYMDIKDDAKVGIKSIAQAHEHNAKTALSVFSAVQVGLLATAGYFAGAGPIFFVGSCGGAVLTLGTMIRRVNLKDVKDCWWWFRNGAWLTGGTISLGLLGDYLYRRSNKDE
ncbi:4-hydroxybenzoate polyprenyltransferase, mitochondrial [Exophiala dermatitidis]|uniref:4-hydroxybenzoate polyprenyltransferase, mitochondrial n=2 Tax=Exophiala dermatitidis TaxID=5970 RepID=H6BUE1_EXODN|nr:4-hydroxybenzoate hexaprenyltransferase [Exophiala dermatitidis NIH/UT8656]EHY55683.1 4-hydroxybenzoate hexaprenyltransferase [Exophiala dermatitidis NIH/UT8656]